MAVAAGRARIQIAGGRTSSSGLSHALAGEVLPAEFYARPVVEVAVELIGCVVEHAGCSGRIVETEAYHESEPACHAFIGVTERTKVLFEAPGTAYVYRSYGIHALFNAVCEPAGIGAAVLIRALEPLEGVAAMRARRGRGGRRHESLHDRTLCSGPGKLTQALGIEMSENGGSLLCGPVVIRARESGQAPRIVSSPRVGITKAVDLKWRFCAVESRYLSRPG
jgi:DNA-3-methyladenine glycosylase